MKPMFSQLSYVIRLIATTTPLRLAVFLSLAVAATWPALGQAGEMNVFFDAQFLSAYERNARLSVLGYHQLPLWDPYFCGGIYGLSAPQTRYASPFFLLTLLLGVETATALMAALLPALAMEGMFRYARHWGARPPAALLAAPLFPLTGFFGYVWHLGWFQFFSFCLVPWILVSLRGALRGDTRAAYYCAVWVGVTVGIGGTYTLPMVVLPGLVEFVCALQATAKAQPLALRLRVALRGVAITSLLVLGVAAFRLWPMIESAGVTLRLLGGLPERSAGWLARALFLWAEPGHDVEGRYFVPPLVVLSLVGLLRARRAGLWALAALSFGLSLGHISPHAPFSLMRKLPIYETLRHPERFLLLCVLAVSLLTALGFSDVLARARRHGQQRHAWVLVLATLFGTLCWSAQLNSGRVYYASARTETPPDVRQDAGFRQSRGNRWLTSHFAAEGMGSLACGEAYPVPMSQRLRGDLSQEEYLVGPGGNPSEHGEVRRLQWSPNRIDLHVQTDAPARLAINQNYHPGWRTSVGEVRSWEGLLSVQVPAGEHDVTVRFVPRSGYGGILATLLTLLMGGLFASGRGARRWQRGALLCAGPGVMLVLWLAWPEAPLARPVPRNADHERVLLEALPKRATPLSAHFDVPLTIEAGAVPADPVAEGGVVTLELFARRTGKLKAVHSLFVHLRGPHGELVGADHAALSGMVYLPRMPLDTLVWDRFQVALPRRSAGTWRVYVGLYDAFGDGSRRHLVHAAPGAEIDRDSIFVGAFEVAPR